MTRDEIMAMVPGLKLNLLIATKLFGWIPWLEKRGDYNYVVFQKPGEDEPYKRQQRWESIKDRYSVVDINEIDEMKQIVSGLKGWSTDVAAVWEVVRELNKDGVYLEIKQWFGQELWIRLWTGSGELRASLNLKSIDAFTEAICKAALLAMEES